MTWFNNAAWENMVSQRHGLCIMFPKIRSFRGSNNWPVISIRCIFGNFFGEIFVQTSDTRPGNAHKKMCYVMCEPYSKCCWRIRIQWLHFAMFCLAVLLLRTHAILKATGQTWADSQQSKDQVGFRPGNGVTGAIVIFEGMCSKSFAFFPFGVPYKGYTKVVQRIENLKPSGRKMSPPKFTAACVHVLRSSFWSG